MLYLFETEIPDKKSIIFALMRIAGLGKTNAALICKKLGFACNLKVTNLSRSQQNKLKYLIENSDLKLAGDLKRLKSRRIKSLIFMRSYRGLRISQGLPVRGQRTHTNARTAKKRR
jgi:small subunit ribosomal protein S13